MIERVSMRLLCFASQLEDINVLNLFSAVLADSPGGMHFFSDLGRMAAWLKIPPRRFSTTVLLPANDRELVELVRLNEFFQDRKVILSLPQVDCDSIALAHRLRPVYIVTAPGELKNVVPILKKLTRTRSVSCRPVPMAGR